MKKYGNTIACESGSNKVHSEETGDRKDLHGRVPFMVVITLHLSHSRPKDPICTKRLEVIMSFMDTLKAISHQLPHKLKRVLYTAS